MAAAAPLILLTGATGFIGRHVHQALAACGIPVRAVLRTGTEARLSAAAERIVTTSDLFSETSEWWTQACRGVDIVVHVAWYTVPGVYLHSLKNTVCLAGTLELARGAIAAGVQRFVGIGTCFEYEVGDGPLTVETPLGPQTPYAAAKAQAFRDLSALLPSRGVEFAWCRPFYLYGDGEDERRFVPYLRRRLAAGEPAELTSGTQVRDFLDVREAGAMIAGAALGTAQGALNICSGVPISLREFAEHIADGYGRRDLLRFGVRADNAFDPPRIVGAR